MPEHMKQNLMIKTTEATKHDASCSFYFHFKKIILEFFIFYKNFVSKILLHNHIHTYLCYSSKGQRSWGHHHHHYLPPWGRLTPHTWKYSSISCLFTVSVSACRSVSVLLSLTQQQQQHTQSWVCVLNPAVKHTLSRKWLCFNQLFITTATSLCLR